MTPTTTLTKAALSLLALLVLALPVQAQSGGIAFRNETQTPLLVQGASLVNGMLQRGQPLTIYPDRTGYDVNLPPGIRQITISDPNQAGRVLLRENVPYRGKNLLFTIIQVGNSFRLVAEKQR
jgi:hypothetical protein